MMFTWRIGGAAHARVEVCAEELKAWMECDIQQVVYTTVYHSIAILLL